jgi:glycogen synthase
MRILFVSTFYPPYIVGGWEQLVQEINHQLQIRGHTTHVLTSVLGVMEPTYDDGVDRLLNLESDLYHYRPLDFLSRKRRLKENLAYLEQTIEKFNPHLIFIHIMWNLDRKVAWLAEQLCPNKVVYYIADHWPYTPDTHTSYWRNPAKQPLLKVAKQILAPIPIKVVERETKKHQIKFQNVLSVSQYIKEALVDKGGLISENIAVIYNGIDTSKFRPKEFDLNGYSKELSLLYAGSLVWHKGVHTAIEAMALLTNKHQMKDVSLTIVGSGHPDYETQIRSLVEREGQEQWVRFLGRVERDEMPALLKRFDVLILPSIWDEPLARIVQEAMASGLVVIGTDTGGTKEIIKDYETGLIFPPGDSNKLAECIKRLIDDPDLVTSFAKNGRELVERQFDIRRMVDEIENYLECVVKKGN